MAYFVAKLQTIIEPFLSKWVRIKRKKMSRPIIQLPESYLDTEFHFHIINLIDASNHQVNLDVGWTIR